MGLQSKALFWTLMSGSSTVATSAAVSMLSAEQQGLALDFTDSFFFSRYGLYGSASVKDMTTPANAYNSIPGDLLTYTGTTKLTRQSDGVYRYGPHNLYVNSASPANQSVTVVSGAAYAITLTGSVSITLSGATTGTVTAGTTTFTAGTTTLTCGSTSGTGTVHVRRTPSDSTYMATGASAKYGLPFEWSAAGALQGILVEPQATNLFLNNTTGATQTITVSNATAYTVSFFGTGSITFSGANSSTLNGTGATDRVSTTFTTSSTSLACTVSGSITDVQVETGSVATSVIRTYAASVTRAADASLSVSAGLFPVGASVSLLFDLRVFNPTTAMCGLASDATHYVSLLLPYNTTKCYLSVSDSTSQALTALSGDLSVPFSAKLAVAAATNDFIGAYNGTLSAADTSGTVPSLGSAALFLGSRSGTSAYAMHAYIKRVLVIPRRMSNAELQALTT